MSRPTPLAEIRVSSSVEKYLPQTREVPGSIPFVSNCFQGLLGVRCVVTFRFNASVSPALRLAVTGGVACDLEGCAAEVCQVVLVRLVLSRNIVQMRCFCVPGHCGIV